MQALFARLSRLDPKVILFAIVVGSIAFVAAKRYGGSTDEIAGWVAAVVALFMRAEKKAGADAAEHVDGTDALGPVGETGPGEKVTWTSTHTATKREILTAYACNGREINSATEAAAELATLAIIERCARSMPIEVPDVPVTK